VPLIAVCVVDITALFIVWGSKQNSV